MFWRRKHEQRDDGEPDLVDEQTVEPPLHDDELVPIRIYTDTEVVDGWTHLGSQRLSDLLNAEDMLSVTRVERNPTEGDWRVVERERMLLVVAPPHSSPRQLRVHRQKREILVQSAKYAVSGTVHLVPGNRLDRTVLRTRQHFLPITDARLMTQVRPGTEEEYDIVLVNVVNVGDDLSLEVVE